MYDWQFHYEETTSEVYVVMVQRISAALTFWRVWQMLILRMKHPEKTTNPYKIL